MTGLLAFVPWSRLSELLAHPAANASAARPAASTTWKRSENMGVSSGNSVPNNIAAKNMPPAFCLQPQVAPVDSHQAIGFTELYQPEVFTPWQANLHKFEGGIGHIDRK